VTTTEPGEDLEPILLRIAAGARVIAGAWVGILVFFSYLLTREAMDRPWLPIGVAVVVAVWAIVSVGWSATAPHRLTAVPTLVVDAALGAGSLLAAAGTGDGVLTYSGGFPLIVVAIASIHGRRAAWSAAALMALVTLAARPGGVGDAVGSIVLYAAGAAIFTWVIRVLRISDRRHREAEERRRQAESARVRAEERVEISRHLHDSVLQTLALIQRKADSPAAVTVLARKQERDLRDWLFGEVAVGGAFNDAVRKVAADVEERYALPVELVTSGDAELTESGAALVAAAAEAMTNAAAHSGSASLSVFTEAATDALRIFVRDRGSGFDPDHLPADRLGVRESIVGRIAGRGGTATVRSEAGWGTEWRLEVRR
jgi:signal transduction histidine kinase